MQPISPRTYKVIFLIIFLAIGFGVFAQTPNLLNYQGVARNAVGNPLPNQSMNLRLSVHNLSASGTVVYSETRPITTNLGGLFSVQIGSAGTTSSTGTLGGVNWLSGDKYLQVEIDPASNNNYLNLGTVQLVAVPYAFNAATAGNATTATKLAAPKNINGVAFDGSADISIAAAASAELLTGTNIKSTVIGSSLTSVGTLTNLTVSNPIVGSITGNAATATTASTVTTNANLTGDVTSVGNATTIANNAVTTVRIVDGAITNAKVTDVAATKITGTLPVSNGGTGAATLTGLVKGNGTGAMTAAVAGTDYLTPTGSAAGLTNFPTFNQKTTGNAATATKLETPKNINGVAFDGTGDITVTADAGTLTGNTLKSTVTGSSLTSVGTLTNLTVTNPIVGSITGNAATASNLTGLTTPVATLNNLSGVNTGDQTNILGNAATATKLTTARNINGVSFDGTGDITVTADAGTLTGNTLKSTVTGSSLTSVGTLANLTVTNPISGSVTGNASTSTNLTGLTTSVATLNNLSGVNTGDQTTITGNAATATKLAASKNINGVAFDGTADITIAAAAAAEQLTGTTLKSTVTGSSLTSVGTLANLTVTNPIVGSITGNAATATTATTVTTNANLTGDVTSVGNATTIADNAVTTAKIANANVTLAKLENLSPGAIIVGNTSNRPTAVSISGDAVLSPTGELIITTGAITTSKIATSAVATASIADGAITNAKVTDVAATKITGTLPVANGGTGLSTTPSNGQLDIGNGTGFTRATLTAGTGISITNTSGAVTIASTAVPSGTTAGDMLYWNGTAWVRVPAGTSLPGNQAQTLVFCNGAPTWGTCPAVVSSAPGIGTATAGNASATVAFTAPSNNGGAAITSYTVTSSPGGITATGTSSPIIITGLTLGTPYTFTVTATNSAGTGAASVASNSVTPPYTIGQAVLGGKIAYILQSWDLGYDANVPHGLVATTADISTSAEWGCHGTTISGADGTATGTGNQNTIDIMNGCATAGIAARLCGDLVQGGYSDWYLPSKDELFKLYLNRVAIGGFSTGGFYWSSSEKAYDEAWVKSFGEGDYSQAGEWKNQAIHSVRAIRAF